MTKQSNVTKWDIVRDAHADFKSYSESTLHQSDVYRLVGRIFDYLREQIVCGRDVELRGFGSFRRIVFEKRIGRNPNNPSEPIVVPRHFVIKFGPSCCIKDAIKNQSPPDSS